MVLRRAPGAALAAATLVLAGCTTTVSPPAQVSAPARIAVLDHGRHASLILEAADGGMLRYGYGDWDWYALGQTGVLEGIAAVLWPTPAGLGRMRYPGPFSPAAVAREVRLPVEHALYLVVEADKVAHLTERLDRIFAENSEAQVHSDLRDLTFVPHPEPYWIGHNSNLIIARWLEDLGCEVTGASILSDWRRGTRRVAPDAS